MAELDEDFIDNSELAKKAKSYLAVSLLLIPVTFVLIYIQTQFHFTELVELVAIFSPFIPTTLSYLYCEKGEQLFKKISYSGSITKYINILKTLSIIVFIVVLYITFIKK